MAMFNSKLLVYQRVTQVVKNSLFQNRSGDFGLSDLAFLGIRRWKTSQSMLTW
jgi:hypothetical protein